MRGRASSSVEALILETVARTVRVHDLRGGGRRIELVAGIARVDLDVLGVPRAADVEARIRLLLAETIRTFETRRRQGANPEGPLDDRAPTTARNGRGRRGRRMVGSRA